MPSVLRQALMFEPERTKMQPTKQRGEKGKKKKRRRSGRFLLL